MHIMAVSAFAFPGNLSRVLVSNSIKQSLLHSNWLSGTDLQLQLNNQVVKNSSGVRASLSEREEYYSQRPPTPLLDTINYPIHMKNLSTKVAFFSLCEDNIVWYLDILVVLLILGHSLIRELKQLAHELRSDIIFNVSKTGGHLGSSLGVVELTVALHYVFNCPQDKILWDVGHQPLVAVSINQSPLSTLGTSSMTELDYKRKIKNLEALVQQVEESKQKLNRMFKEHCDENDRKDQRIIPLLQELNSFRVEFRRRGFKRASPTVYLAFLEELVQILQSNCEFLKIELYETRVECGQLWRKTEWRTDIVDSVGVQPSVRSDLSSVPSRVVPTLDALAKMKKELLLVTELKNKLQADLGATKDLVMVYKTARDHLYVKLQQEQHSNIALDWTNMELLERLALYDRPDLDIEKEIQRILQESDDLKKTEGENSDALKPLEKRLSQLLAIQNSITKQGSTLPSVPGSTSRKKRSSPQPPRDKKPVQRRRRN